MVFEHPILHNGNHEKGVILLEKSVIILHLCQNGILKESNEFV